MMGSLWIYSTAVFTALHILTSNYRLAVRLYHRNWLLEMTRNEAVVQIIGLSAVSICPHIKKLSKFEESILVNWFPYDVFFSRLCVAFTLWNYEAVWNKIRMNSIFSLLSANNRPKEGRQGNSVKALGYNKKHFAKALTHLVISWLLYP